jgi:RNA polymerase sigma-70 factor, ECF subfamily
LAVERIKDMDFETIYREYRPRIYRYLSHLTTEADAPDLTQAVFLKVSRSLDSFRGESSLSTWIYRIATNTAHDFGESALVRQREAELLVDDARELDEMATSIDPSAESQCIRREMNDCIQGMVQEIPESYRDVVMLSDFGELSNAEIAGVLGISLDTVKIRLHRGRKVLRGAMQCKCDIYHDESNELVCDRK